MRKITAIMITPCAAFCVTLIVLMVGLLLWEAEHSPIPPWSLIDYWVERNQTLIASLGALIGGSFVF